MGLFDKLVDNLKNSNKKNNVKIIMGSSKNDDQEQFLKPDNSMIVTVEPDSKPAAKTKKAEPRKSEVIKVPAKKEEAKKVAASKDNAVKSKEKSSQKVSKTKAEDKTTVKVKIPSSQKNDDNDSYTKGSVTVSEGKDTRNGKFDIQKAKDGRFFFNLYASNHTVIAYSQIYSSTSGAMNGINSVIANAAKSPIEDTTLKNPTELACPKWEIYIDKAGEYRFRLYASNGQCICHAAHGYSSKSGCKGGIDSIGRFASDAATIDKSYLE